MNKKINNKFLSIILSIIVCSCSNNNVVESSKESSSISTTNSSDISSIESSNSSSSNTSTPNYEIKFDKTKEVTITFYHTMGHNLQDILNMYLEDFALEYPNITVEHQQIGTYDDISNQLVTEISSGAKNCDITYCYPDHIAMYNKANKVVPLNNLIADDEYGMSQAQVDDFVSAYLNEGKVKGDDTLYCLPFSKSSEVMYYDKTFFTNNSIEVPDHWFTTGVNDKSSMEYVCEQIKSIDKNSIPLGYDSTSNWFITMCQQLGAGYTSTTGENFLFDNTVTRQFCETYRTWYKNGWVTTKDIYKGYTSSLFTNDINGENKTRCYMCIGSSAGATYQRPAKLNDKYPWEVGITNIPQDDADDGKVISQGPSICILNNGEDQKIAAAWLLARFLTTSLEFQCQFSMTSGYTPVLKSCQENDIYKGFLNSADGGDNIAALTTKVSTEQSDWYFVSPAFIGSSQAREEVGNLLTAIMTCEASSKEEYDNFVSTKFDEAITRCKAVQK